jgi:hypothetical protein
MGHSNMTSTALGALLLLAGLMATTASCAGTEVKNPGGGRTATTAAASPSTGAPFTARLVPSGDAVVGHEGAWVDPDRFAVNDAGDVLAYVHGGGFGSEDPCQDTATAALLWQSHDGSRRALGGAVAGRDIVPAQGGGFAVGPRPRHCDAPSPILDARGGYLVTADGSTVHLRWPVGSTARRARRVCFSHTRASARCVFSATDATVNLRSPAPRAPNGRRSDFGPGGLVTAHSADQRDLWWSADGGRSWQHRKTPLDDPRSRVPSDRGVTRFALEGNHGDAVLGFYTESQVDVSLDSGRSWSVRDLPALPADLGPYWEVWVSGSGVLLALAPTADGRSETLVRSVDAAWSRVAAAPVRSTRLPMWVVVHGDTVNLTNPDVVDVRAASPWWISTDAGATWRRNDLLGPADH